MEKSEEERIKNVFYKFEDSGLVSKDIEQVLSCFSDRLLGIGIGEQGFVHSKQDIRRVYEAGIKAEDDSLHSLEYGQIEILIHGESFATLCAQVRVISRSQGEHRAVLKSEFFQTLSFIMEQDDWKICALHASTPVITEEALEAFPLNFAEKTLQSLKEKIGEKAYMVEEQYRQAILADAVAFYIINFTLDKFEKCQINSDCCAYVKAGVPYEAFIFERSAEYILEEDKNTFLETFLRENILKAFQNEEKQLSYEYRLKLSNGSFIWVVTICRLITDVVTGDQKGIMYVKNIDKSKRDEIAILNRATYDEMTGIYNKGAMKEYINHFLETKQGEIKGVFVMLDVDDFKHINDNFGHPTGDRVLIAIADELKESFYQGSLIGRLGGDEFGVFIKESYEMESLLEILEGLMEQIRNIRIADGAEIRITCSMGASHCKPGSCFEEVYKQADNALYLSKKRGKNQITYQN